MAPPLTGKSLILHLPTEGYSWSTPAIMRSSFRTRSKAGQSFSEPLGNCHAVSVNARETGAGHGVGAARPSIVLIPVPVLCRLAHAFTGGTGKSTAIAGVGLGSKLVSFLPAKDSARHFELAEEGEYPLEMPFALSGTLAWALSQVGPVESQAGAVAPSRSSSAIAIVAGLGIVGLVLYGLWERRSDHAMTPPQAAVDRCRAGIPALHDRRRPAVAGLRRPPAA